MTLLRTLSCHQLAKMIRKGREVEACKAEWRRRWAMDWPYRRAANGIVKEDE